MFRKLFFRAPATAPQAQPVQEKELKIVFLPPDSSNSTDALTRFKLLKSYLPNTIQVFGIDFVYKEVAINNQIIKARLWDLARQPVIPNSSTAVYLKNTDCYVIAVDITKENWAEVVEKTYQNYKTLIGTSPISVIGMTDKENNALERDFNQFLSENQSYMRTSPVVNINDPNSIEKITDILMVTAGAEDIGYIANNHGARVKSAGR